MPGEDTKLAFSKTMNRGKKRTRVSQQASSGAPQPAPERAPDLGADVQKERSSSSSAKQGGQRIQVGQPSRSGAPEPAAIDGAVQFDNDDDKKLGRLRKRMMPTCEERMAEEQAARSARSRKKAIKSFRWCCGV